MHGRCTTGKIVQIFCYKKAKTRFRNGCRFSFNLPRKKQRLALKTGVATALPAFNLHNFIIKKDCNTSKNLVSPI
jgi:hypothetical protein